eukprot:IDg8575t1
MLLVARLFTQPSAKIEIETVNFPCNERGLLLRAAFERSIHVHTKLLRIMLIPLSVQGHLASRKYEFFVLRKRNITRQFWVCNVITRSAPPFDAPQALSGAKRFNESAGALRLRVAKIFCITSWDSAINLREAKS